MLKGKARVEVREREEKEEGKRRKELSIRRKQFELPCSSSREGFSRRFLTV